MHDRAEVQVAVVSSRHELDLAITTWVPGYVARQATDLDTVIDLTSEGGLVLVDLADEDRTGWVRELRARGFEAPLVVLAPDEADDRVEFDGSVLVSGPLQVGTLGDAFDAALRRDPERLHRWVAPEPPRQPSAPARDRAEGQDGGAASTAAATPVTEPRKRLFSRSRRAPTPHSDQIAASPPEHEASGHEALPPPHDPSSGPDPRTVDRGHDAATSWHAAGPEQAEQVAPEGPATDPERRDTTSTDMLDAADVLASPDAIAALPPPGERPMVAEAATAYAWAVLDDLDPVVRAGGAVVGVRASDASFAIIAGIGIAPFEGAASVPGGHRLIAAAGTGPSVLHVPSTQESHLPLAGIPLADCPALLVMLVPGQDEAAALVIIGRDGPFEEAEISQVTDTVLETQRTLDRVARAHRGDGSSSSESVSSGPPFVTRGGEERGRWPTNEGRAARVVAAPTVAAWRLIDQIFPLLEHGAAIVALRATHGGYAPVAATRIRALEAVRSIAGDHPLLQRLRDDRGRTVISPRTDSGAITSGLPLTQFTTVMAFAIGPVGQPDALLLVGRSTIVTPSDLQAIEQIIRTGDHDLPDCAAIGHLPRRPTAG